MLKTLDAPNAALHAQITVTSPASLSNPFATVLGHGDGLPPTNSIVDYYNSLFHPGQPQDLTNFDPTWHGYESNTILNSGQFPRIAPQAPASSLSHLLSHLPFTSDEHLAQAATSQPTPSASSSSSAQNGTATIAASGTESHQSRNGSSLDDLVATERTAIAEDKRRRNTEASGTSKHPLQRNRAPTIHTARFRAKRKHKTIVLERSVSDLTGRAEELEREAADLRKENRWLKEIVMMKGTQFVANKFNHRLALGQAAALATGQAIMPTDATTAPSGSQSATTSKSSEEQGLSSPEEEGKREGVEKAEGVEQEVRLSSKGRGKQKLKE